MANQMTTGYHPVLPPLREQHHVGNFNVVGQWDERGRSELETLSEALKVEKQGLDINSIPDMWARPLLFEMALFGGDPKDPKRSHPMHDRVLGEWRGLLAMIALREAAGLQQSLTAVPVEFPAAGTRPQGDAPDFIEAVSKLMPKSTLSSDTPWSTLYILLFNGRPIGMTSPTTLVATATDYYGRITNVPWFDGRYLTDPTEHLSAGMKQGLGDWLKQLEKSLISHPKLDQRSKRWNNLLGLLDGFIARLGVNASGKLSLSNSGLGTQGGIFRYISAPIKGEAPDPKKSHVRLVPSREDAAAVPILVLDRNIASQWHVEEHDVNVWGSISLKTAIPFGGLGDDETRLAGATLQGARAWKPERFFTQKLFVIGQESALPGAQATQGSEVLRHQQQLVTPILPIDKALIDHLTAEDLAVRVSFEQTTSGILVRLRLPLAGPTPGGRDYEVLKEYRADEHEIIFLANVPVLEVWPNFRLSGVDWKAYYTYFSTAGAGSTFYARPYTPGMQEPPESLEAETRRITRTDRFPEVMICEGPVANVQTNRTEMRPAGLLLVSQPKPLPAQNKLFKIGVDFGASGTSVYAREQGQNPVPINFSNRFLDVTDTPPARRGEVYDYFLPTEEVPVPFLSIYHDFLNTTGDKQMRPLIDGHIFFREDYRDLDASASGIATDLKWSAEARDRLNVGAFLEQLCLMAAAEVAVKGASRVEWVYSLPMAFTKDMDRAFPLIWGQVTGAVSGATGLAQTANSPASKTESEAAALYFKSAPQLNASTHAGAICIDIGGSTSDIAVWQEDRLRWQTSLRLAGRDIFLEFLHARPDFLAMFGADVTGLHRTAARRSAFYAQADAILRQMGKEIFKALPAQAGSRDVQELTGIVALGLSGLFFYVGSVLRYLMNTGRYKEEAPDIYIGGNGSLMFNWLDAGEYTKSSRVNKLFKEAFLRGAGLARESVFKITISPNPKAEAAYGLVSDGVLNSDDTSEGVVAGERFREGGQEKAWDEVLDAKRLAGAIEVSPRLERLQEFLATFNGFARASGIPAVASDDAMLREVRNRTASSLSQFKGREDDPTVLVEPIFIIALKHVLEVQLER